MNAFTPAIAAPALASRAMLMSLKISQWSARRLDREITDEVNSSHGASADAGRYNKLLIDKEALADVVRVAGEARSEFLKRTLPWMDDGQRIMAADAYLAHSSWFSAQRQKFDDAVEDFLAMYPSHVNAARVKLNGMFRDEDYPTVSELRGKFKMEINVMPVPNASDFRVDMSAEQAELIRRDIEANVQKATATAVGDVYRRVAECCERMVERLNAYKPAKGKGTKSEGVFRDSLVENVRDLIKIMPSLNITGDVRLAEIADHLQEIARFDAKVLREDAEVRKNVAEEAQKILANVSDYF